MITFKHIGGTGWNACYRVLQDGEIVGSIRRSGNAGWTVEGFYGDEIAFAKSIEQARVAARDAEPFPTKRQVYEKLCTRIEQQRFVYIERSYASKLAAAARLVVTSEPDTLWVRISNLRGLLHTIEVYATDRSNPPMPGETHRSGQQYPDAPEEEAKALGPATTA